MMKALCEGSEDNHETMMLVAVYGTLKHGMINHVLLKEARYLGVDLLDSITLYDLGDYPAAVLEPSSGVQVEVYWINERILMALDKLEEYDRLAPERGLYRRCLCHTRYGRAWIYIFNGAVSELPRIWMANWQPAV